MRTLSSLEGVTVKEKTRVKVREARSKKGRNDLIVVITIKIDLVTK